MPRDAKITRPSIKGELRIVGFDESVIKEEIGEIVIERGECEYDEINVGNIRPMRNGLFMVWVQCPLAAAVKVANTGKIRLGWSMARVELLEARPQQCFKCWEFGHVRSTCTSKIDRSALCFKCGKSGHSYKDCKNELLCILCAQKGLEASHRIGSFKCKIDKRPRANRRDSG